MTRKDYAIQVLKQNCPFDEDTMNKILYGRGREDRKCLSAMLESTMGGFGNEAADQDADEDLVADILYAMNLYILGYRAVPAFKQKLYTRCTEWITCIAKYYNILDVDLLIKEEMVEPIHEDPMVAFVKSIHAFDDRTAPKKNDLAAELGVKEKTIRNWVNQLDPGWRKAGSGEKIIIDNKNIPRFGGQVLQVDVETATEKREVKYYTPETLNPVALQMNVTQVGIVLKGLQLANDMDVSDNSMDLAINVWTQLSPYCQKRLKDYYHPDDETFHSFIELVDATSNDEGNDHYFKTEIEMFESESVRNQINMAHKGSRSCNIRLKGAEKALRNCMIDYDEEGYFIIDGENKIRFKPDDIAEIGLEKQD